MKSPLASANGNSTFLPTVLEAWHSHVVPRSTTTARRRLVHLHNFRGASIILIVAIHCLSVFDWSASPELGRFLRVLLANGTVFFLFISGFLSDYLSPTFRLGSHYRGKFQNVLLPYVVVSIPALVAFTVFLQRPGVRAGFYDQPAWRQVTEFLLTGAHLAPLWFIPTILVFQAAAPIFHWLFRNKRMYWVLPLLFLIPVFVPRAENNPLQLFVYFLPVWVLGMAASRLSRVYQAWVKAGGFYTLILAAAWCVVGEFSFAAGTYSFYSYLGKAILSLVLLEAFRRIGDRASPVLAQAGTLSFGIFFLHSYVITAGKMLEMRLLGHAPEGSVLALVLVALAALLITMVVVMGVRRALGAKYSRMAIGY